MRFPNQFGSFIVAEIGVDPNVAEVSFQIVGSRSAPQTSDLWYPVAQTRR
jgi:hypothetical protein